MNKYIKINTVFYLPLSILLFGYINLYPAAHMYPENTPYVYPGVIQNVNITVDLDSQLIQSIEKGKTEEVKKLIAQGANVNARGEVGCTAFMIASIWNRPEIAQLLIDANANIHAKNANGNTALVLAARFGSKDIVKLLINHKADVNAVDDIGYPILVYGRDDDYVNKENYLEIVKLLVEAGADVNVANEDGFTPLMSAARDGLCEVVKLFIEKGANINAITKDNIDEGYKQTALLEAIYGECCYSCSHEGGYGHRNYENQKRYTGLVKILLDAGADLDLTDSDGKNAISHLKKIAAAFYRTQAGFKATPDLGKDLHIQEIKKTATDLIKLLLAEPSRREAAQKRREKMTGSLKQIACMPQVLSSLIDSYLPTDLPGILFDYTEAQKSSGQSTEDNLESIINPKENKIISKLLEIGKKAEAKNKLKLEIARKAAEENKLKRKATDENSGNIIDKKPRLSRSEIEPQIAHLKIQKEKIQKEIEPLSSSFSYLKVTDTTNSSELLPFSNVDNGDIDNFIETKLAEIEKIDRQIEVLEKMLQFS